MKPLLVVIFFLCFATYLCAQQDKLIDSGTIDFEKTVNTYAICKKIGMSEPAFEAYKNSHNQFLVLKSTLYFNNNQALFVPILEQREIPMLNSVMTFPYAVQRNLIYSDFSSHNFVNQKKLFEEIVLIADTLRQIKWKLTDEFREIVGHTCRRANAVICDSIYVVAFYTNEIHISGGPELFTGLPGMILELALPHDNIIWRAVKITSGNGRNSIIKPPKDGTRMNLIQLEDKINSSMKEIDPKLKGILVIDMLI